LILEFIFSLKLQLQHWSLKFADIEVEAKFWECRWTLKSNFNIANRIKQQGGGKCSAKYCHRNRSFNCYGAHRHPELKNPDWRTGTWGIWGYFDTMVMWQHFSGAWVSLKRCFKTLGSLNQPNRYRWPVCVAISWNIPIGVQPPVKPWDIARSLTTKMNCRVKIIPGHNWRPWSKF